MKGRVSVQRREAPSPVKERPLPIQNSPLPFAGRKPTPNAPAGGASAEGEEGKEGWTGWGVPRGYWITV